VKSNYSISLRLTFWFSGIFLAGFVVFGALIWLDLDTSLSQGRDRTLAHRAERMADLLEHTRNDPRSLLQKKYFDFVEATPEGNLIQVYSLDGKRILVPNDVDKVAFPWPDPFGSQEEYEEDLWYRGQPYRAFIREAIFNGAPVRIFVGGQLSDNHNLLTRLAEILERSIPIMLVVSALAGYFISRRAMMPVVRLTESARCITIGNLAARLPVSPVRDELARLAETCNQMLSRLEEAVKRITQFTADASHELRSPIAFIRAASEDALYLPGLPIEAIQTFKSIVSETEHSSCLLEDMLLLARFDAGRAPLGFEQIFLAELVQSVVSKMQVLAGQKHQNLSTRLSEEDLESVGDAPMLRRLIWILIDNAVKYTPSESVIDVALVRDGQEARLTVSDNGPGIPEAHLPHIFDRFFRVDPSRGEQEGTGLGLAIAKRIAETHHAKIKVRSREGKGTTFEVTFPLVNLVISAPNAF
jgi:heavy metal sensor kinase